MLELCNLEKRYQNIAPIQKFSLALPCKGVVALMGPSGCGKTTLLRILAGLEKADSGSLHGLAGKKLSMVFQEDRLLNVLTAADNIRVVLPKRAEADQLVTQLLDELELAAVGDFYPAQLSGGMQRRVAIARALAYSGEVLLLDEPLKGLDQSLKQKVMNQVRKAANNALILLVTHDMQEACYLADSLLLFSGPPLTLRETVLLSPAQRESWQRTAEHLSMKIGRGSQR